MSAVLAGLKSEQGFDPCGCAAYVGTSAGSIVAASLVAGLDPAERLGRRLDGSAHLLGEARRAPLGWGVLSGAADLALGGAAPLLSLAAAAAAPGGALTRRLLLSRVPVGSRSLAPLASQVEDAGLRWDGRLRVVAVERESGRRVVFGAPGAPDLPVWSAVVASCAIPGVFRPVHAHGRTYVDGGVWSPTNIDALALARGMRVLCLNPTGSLRPGPAGVSGAFGVLSRSIAHAEALLARSRGATVMTVNPDGASAAAMGANLMDPSRREAVIDAGLAQGLRLAGAGARSRRVQRPLALPAPSGARGGE